MLLAVLLTILKKLLFSFRYLSSPTNITGK